MRIILLLFTGIALTLSIGCGTSTKKTDLMPVPPARTGGPLRIALVPAEEDMTKEEIIFLKSALIEKFDEAGFDSVVVVKTRKNEGTELDIKVVTYEQSTTGNKGCIVTSAVCADVCICLAPCLLPVMLAPNYYDAQFSIAADVSGYRSGRRLFTDRVQEEGHTPANVGKVRNAKFKDELEKLTINNFVAKIMDKMNQQYDIHSSGKRP